MIAGRLVVEHGHPGAAVGRFTRRVRNARHEVEIVRIGDRDLAVHQRAEVGGVLAVLAPPRDRPHTSS